MDEEPPSKPYWFVSSHKKSLNIWSQTAVHDLITEVFSWNNFLVFSHTRSGQFCHVQVTLHICAPPFEHLKVFVQTGVWNNGERAA